VGVKVGNNGRSRRNWAMERFVLGKILPS